MGYKLSDAAEATIGIFASLLLFLAIRQDSLSINPTIGLIITVIWVSLFYNGRTGLPRANFFIDLGITFVIAGALTLVFGLVTTEQLLSFDYFGSTAIVAVWISYPMSLLFDRYNIKNILRRYYVR